MSMDGRYATRRQEPVWRCPWMDGMPQGGRSRCGDVHGWTVCHKEAGAGVIKDKTTLILTFSLREKGSIPLSLRGIATSD